MKRWAVTGLIALIVLALPLGAVCAAQRIQGQDGTGDWVVFGDSVTVSEDEIVRGNVIVIGGDLRLDEGGQVEGDVVAVGGSLEVAGEVGGDVVSVGAVLDVDEAAQVRGETVAVGGEANVDQTGLAGGFVVTPGPDLRTFTLPSVPSLPTFGPPSLPRRGTFAVSRILERLLAAVNGAVILGVLAALVLLLWPEPVERIGRAVNRAPAAAGGVGCLSIMVVPLVGTLLAVTLILIPFSFLLALAFLAVLLFGWVAVGLLFGERLLEWLGTREITARNAGIVGTFGLTLLVGLVGALPGLGWLSALSSVALATVGVGAVVLTRFGWRAYGPVTVGAGELPAAIEQTSSEVAVDADAEKGDN
jgi:hypothetical protein